LLAAIVAVGAFAGLFFLGWVPHRQRMAELDKETTAATESKPLVEVARPRQATPAFDIRLPADTRANQETPIFPRANGYLKRLLVDIGDRVKEGQLLAEIDIPDLDAQLNEAQAAVTQAKANVAKGQDDYALAKATVARWEALSTTPGAVSPQQLDERRAAAAQAGSALEALKANVAAAEATVQRLASLQGFAKVTAPFSGVITARNYDVGALMNSSGSSNGQPLFRLADTDTLRVFVNVPQPYVSQVQPGQPVKINVRNQPGRDFEGTVTRSAGALDPTNRTLRYEVMVPNKEGLLYAGMYAEVRVRVTQEAPPLMIPTSALVFDAGGARVWTVGPDNKVRSKSITVGRDFGTDMEVEKGLAATDQIVTNPGARLTDGLEVTPRVPAATASTDQPNPTNKQASAR
jgi:RND family efflux transporter MFP subunit